MGFPNCKTFTIKVYETPEGNWTVYFTDEAKDPFGYVFYRKAPTWGELLMTVIMDGYKYMKGTLDK